MAKDKMNKKSSKKPANKKQREKDKEKIKELLVKKANELEEAAKTLAPDFDFETEIKLVEEEDSIIDAIEADKEEVKKKIKKILDVDEKEVEEAANRIAPDFDYEAAAEELEIEMRSGSHFVWKDFPSEEVATAAPATESNAPVAEASAEELESPAEKLKATEELEAEAVVEEIETEPEVEEPEAVAEETVETETLDTEEVVEEATETETETEVVEEELMEESETEIEAETEVEEDVEVEELEAVAEDVAATETDTAEEMTEDPELEEAKSEEVETEAEEVEAKTEEAEAEEEPEVKEPAPLPEALVSPSKYLKPAYTPKTGVGRFFLKDRHRGVLAATLAMLIAIAGWQAFDYLVPKDISLIYKTYGATEEANYSTKARTVGELKKELSKKDRIFKNSDVLKTDVFNYHKDKPISNHMTITVMHAKETRAVIGGETQTFWLVPGTVKDNLAFNDIEYDKNDEIKPSLGKWVNEKSKIRVDEVHYKVAEKTEKVKAESKVVLDPSLTSGVQETTEGKDGEGIFTYTKKYVNGKKVNTDRKVKKWIKKPQDNALRLGTSATGDKGTFRVVRTFVANTTAYTAGLGARGSLGETVHVGTCAVDPSFVSYRSEMWIEGYGYAYANDTGGAVNGNVVDLYMSSHSQCIQWGRRNMNAYVLERID